MLAALFIVASSCSADLPEKDCTPQPALEVMVTIGLVILAIAVLLLIFNRLTHHWASSDEMATAVLAPIIRLINRIPRWSPSKDPRDYHKPGRWERR
jgi:hypothetical protein